MTYAVVRPPYVRSGHFYSPISSGVDIERALGWGRTCPASMYARTSRWSCSGS
jgi:hypothetical protein